MTENDNLKSQHNSWRDDIDSLIFYPPQHAGFCAVHRRAFRALLGSDPTPHDCIEYFNKHRTAFQAAAAAKISRDNIAAANSLHINSRDVKRQLSVASSQPSVKK